MRVKRFWLFGSVNLMLLVGFSAAITTICISKVAHGQRPRRVEGAISGHVYQVNGQPISGATIEVIRMDAGGQWQASTESDGSYKVTGLSTGDYTVRAFKQGFAREYHDNVVFSGEATIIQITAPEEITGIDFNLNEGGSISGCVYNNETAEPIQGARIKAVPSGEEADAGFRTFTDSNGRYTVDCLALGAYKVNAKATGFIGLWYGNVHDTWFATDVKVIPLDNTPNINFSLSRGGSISGFVFDAHRNPIQGAHVHAGAYLRNDDWIGRGAETRSDGSYIITDLPASDYYKVWVKKPGFALEWYDSKVTKDAADNVAVTEGNDTSGINFTLDIAGSITGHVYEDKDGTPISGIGFVVRLTTGEEAGEFPYSEYDGSYTIWLRTGNYLIRATSSSRGGKYISEWYDNSYNIEDATIVNVIAPNETPGIDFYLAKAGSISGYIYSDDGEPIGDASVYAFSDIFPGNGANSQSDGSYTIEGLPSGNYTVQVTVTGYFSEYKHRVIVDAPDNTPGINFTLKKMPANFYIEGFETGDFSRLRWRHYGDANWNITSRQKNSGTYSAQAGSIGDNESTSLETTFDCVSGDITFYRKDSSESGCDYLRFYIDGVEQDFWSGEQDWARVSFPVETGIRIFTWTYSKDSSVSSGSDTAWIDDIVFPVPP